jgi:G:T-mismatch repair DNA endonuclease (very short patch repair protein)
MPSTRREFWKAKLEGNAQRDKRNLLKLKALGWRVLVVWECELARPEMVLQRLKRLIVETDALSRR